MWAELISQRLLIKETSMPKIKVVLVTGKYIENLDQYQESFNDVTDWIEISDDDLSFLRNEHVFNKIMHKNNIIQQGLRTYARLVVLEDISTDSKKIKIQLDEMIQQIKIEEQRKKKAAELKKQKAKELAEQRKQKKIQQELEKAKNILEKYGYK